MYTLGVPNRQKRRALGYLKQNWINFEENPSMNGFFDLSFPELDEDGFRSIINRLKHQGVTLIGADSQLTERKIMKLTDLLEQDKKPNRMDTAEDVIEKVDEIVTDNPDTALDLISDMIEDFYENQSMDRPDTSLQEQKLKKLIKILVKEWHEQN